MNFGDIARKRLQFLAILAAGLTFSAASVGALAQEAESVEAPVAAMVEGAAPDAAADQAATAAPAFEHFGPDMIKGQPIAAEDDMWASMGFQDQYSETGNYALWMHDAILMPIITVISLFVLGLLLWVIVRFNRRRNPVASKTSHNTFIEVIWTVIPVIILLVIAVPSIRLLAAQYESPPEDAITIKTNGYQWYWGYEYVDNGGFEVISNMMPEADAIAQGYPAQLEADRRMVVPVGVPIRIQTFGADVIHSFAVPSLWFKLDAVPGRINEKVLIVEEEGIYYGQCMELCGARHAYMPIALEARSLEDYNAWVLSQPGGVIAHAEAEVVPAAEVAEEPLPAAEAPAV
ncbi:cytochrome c oxidase subunit II [Altererythrobacter sp. KTW20L]|uniref:cytochrome c oxidase subunit II n=1 Tax=Altererythrobacter sp. KTW20L TaxID=2942210 RepID=UPI0020C0FCD3|nr:cytochrome c oxidase subunit II [Altererythrobacter sp. KTW20L]MCL6250666.1 cytochrome c oxidase subunit II [Altererythrobacter sp. KTW20L]